MHDAAATEDFWSSRPRWSDDTARAATGVPEAPLVVWSSAGVFNVGDPAATIAGFVDGEVTLAELAEDLAAVAEAPLDHARAVVAAMAVELSNLGALEGVALPDPPEPEVDADDPSGPGSGVDPLPTEVGETTRIDPETGLEMRVVTQMLEGGNRVVTEYLPGGGRRVTSTLVAPSGRGDQALAWAEAMAGGRSLAELFPADSCGGSKIRNFDDVPLVSRVGLDGRVRSVRCHHPEVADRLAERFGDSLVEDRGPIEAFVVTPLEGHGPMRLFDGRGARRGRPRTVDAAVNVVCQILGEREAEALSGVLPPMVAAAGLSLPEPTAVGAADGSRGSGPEVDEAVLLTTVAVKGSDGTVHLVDEQSLYGVGLVHRLESAGFEPVWSRVALHVDGTLSVPDVDGLRPLGDTVNVHLSGVGLFPSDRVVALLGEMAQPDGVAPAGQDPGEWRQRWLSAATTVASRSQWSDLTDPLPAHLGVDASA